ncbi:LuxR family transcriptional regulator [Nonomuraea turkmeniaca]|uniref:LuxR family transcriptional regulator n=1 Tax=Nonomuraea turkmeniaca TaxID=103838 RepID=A0A5S4EVB0_9ACTN|nr:LuxR C-terminal-related transcriptional regulator [Nonomuraea turkmeniaca]TMR07039.1 LuxR family transcriptional regulator [Nonomuraea turkmeniaca]
MTTVTTSASRGQHNSGGLPAEVTSFVGRRQEVAEVRQLLSVSRAVTLTGAGGVGKTRLALRVAHEVRRAFRDGVWLVELAALENPGMLARAVAETLEIRDHSTDPPLQVLADHLRDKQTLVILDNCEHLVDECAVLADTLLRAAPELRIMATSRHVLGIASEHAVPVTPLPLPDGDGAPLETLTQTDAVQLFTERARAVLPSFAVTDDNRDVVTGIIRRLDGLPLGIELAAVRLRALSAEQLLERLDDRFRLLTGGSRAVLPRHQTLRALIDWSHALCSEEERLLWHRASVFAGSLDLEGAETVCSGTGIDREDVLDLVIGLVDKSVLIREDHPGGVRYRMLDTLRQYGRERLCERGEEARLRRRHRAYYRDLAGRARAEVFGPEQVAWFNRLQLEHANLRSALDGWLATPADAAIGLSVATDLLYHWITSYYLGEGRAWLERGLAAVTSPDDVRGRALWAGGWLAVIQADLPAARAMLEECHRIGERLGDESLLGYAELFTGMVAMFQERPRDAIVSYEHALERHRGTGDPVGLALSLIRLSLARSFVGESDAAIDAAEQALKVCDAHGDGWHKAYTMMALGVEVWRQGDLPRATELERQSLAFNRSLGDLLGVGITIEVLAWIAATQGLHERAGRLLGVLETVWSLVGAPLSGYGHLAGYHEECQARVREALGEAAFAAAVRRGARLPYEEAVAYALQEDKPGGPDPKEAPEARGEQAALTRREREIAQLVAQGMTNKEIAASLVIAQRTAEGHIEHILTKLGFNSRSQIAVWVGEQARADGDALS